MHGFSVDEIVGMEIADLFAPEVRPSLHEVFAKVHAIGHHTFESVHRRKDGSTFPVLIDATAVRDECGRVLYRAVFVQDLTERKEGEAARARLASVLESTTDAATFVAPDRTIRAWNPAAERMFGWTAEEVLGKPISIMSPPEHAAEARAAFDRVLEGGTLRDFETVRLRKDGSRFEALLTASPIRDAAGRVHGVGGIVRDVTERQRAARALAEAHEAERQLERVRREWTAVVAHDLRQPLNTILLSSQFISKCGSTLVDNEPHARRIRDASQRLSKMIDDLLDASLLEAHRVKLTLTPIDLPELLRETVARAGGVVEPQRVEIEVRSLCPEVLADPARLEQVLVNLLSNAFKYGEPGSLVRLVVSPGLHEVEIAVTNRGTALAPEEVERLFERFYRSTRDADTGTPGLGLGLYIAKGLVEAHGGRIWAEAWERGTTFRFTLPVAMRA
jgi:PAS domain S-box-containing protein